MNIWRDYLEEVGKKNGRSKMEDETKTSEYKNYMNVIETISSTFY